MKFTRLLLGIFLCISAALAGANEFPALSDRFVNDFASMISPNEANELNAKLAKFRDASKVSIVIATITSAQDYGYPTGLIDLGVGLFDKWKPGQADIDSGILVIVAGKTPPYKIRIVTGRGVEGAVPDLAIKNITEGTMKPAMHNGTLGAYALGLMRGTDALMERTKHEFVPKTTVTRQPGGDRSLEFAVPLLLAILGSTLLCLYLYRINKRKNEEAERERVRGEKQEYAEWLKRMSEDDLPTTYPLPTKRPEARRERPPTRPASYSNAPPRSARTNAATAAAAAVAAVEIASTQSSSSNWERSDDSGSGSSSSSFDSFSSPDSGGSTAGGGGGDN